MVRVNVCRDIGTVDRRNLNALLKGGVLRGQSPACVEEGLAVILHSICSRQPHIL